MKNFIVKVQIKVCGYEKIITKLVREINKEEAKKSALLDECHGTIGENAEWNGNGIFDLGEEFYYSISSCVEVKPEHVDVLKLYGI